MDKKIIYVAVAVIILLGLGGYLLMNKTSAPANTSVTQNTPTPAPSEPASAMKTLKDLLSAGVSQKCTYSDTASGVSVSGTSYISGGKIRGDFSTTTAAGQTTTGHMINEGKTSYIWMDGQTTGFKMTFDPANATASGNVAQQQGVDPNKAMNYNCSVWVVDNSLFTPPTSIKFSDFSDVMPKTQNQCATCDTLSGDAKTQCLTALKCS